MQQKTISGFSKLPKKEKMRWVAEQYFRQPKEAIRAMKRFWHSDETLQRVLDGFSENTITNYLMPYGVAPNFLINGQMYAVPMVIEESSVVAAASSAAKFWVKRGGFHARVISTTKIGQVHFLWGGDAKKLSAVFQELKAQLLKEAAPLTANMEKRGGGVLDIELRDLRVQENDYYQLFVTFETCDSMGANFINSVLESFGQTLEQFVAAHSIFSEQERGLTVIMAILSNYTPECLVQSWVSCPVEELNDACPTMEAAAFAERFRQAVRIAEVDPFRATTHNKGIFNGIDAVVLATGNDFRAVESCGHAFAARSGQYRSLSVCKIENGIFRIQLELPLALGTVGGLTKLHPMARCSLEMLGNPGAEELMMIIAATGLAQNFAALRSLVTTGIQKGHMKMHLLNILNHLGAGETDKHRAVEHFQDKVVSFNAVREFLRQVDEEDSAEKTTTSGNNE
jgi:hydroxymethylglutaryl-CoA reductase